MDVHPWINGFMVATASYSIHLFSKVAPSGMARETYTLERTIYTDPDPSLGRLRCIVPSSSSNGIVLLVSAVGAVSIVAIIPMVSKNVFLPCICS